MLCPACTGDPDSTWTRRHSTPEGDEAAGDGLELAGGTDDGLASGLGDALATWVAGGLALGLTAGAMSQGLTGGGAGLLPKRNTPAMPDVTSDRPANAPNA